MNAVNSLSFTMIANCSNIILNFSVSCKTFLRKAVLRKVITSMLYE